MTEQQPDTIPADEADAVEPTADAPNPYTDPEFDGVQDDAFTDEEE